MQHLFYYQRKTCGNKLIKMGKSKSCTIPVKDVEDSFRQRWECENNNCLAKYDIVSKQDQDKLDEQFSITLKMMRWLMQ